MLKQIIAIVIFFSAFTLHALPFESFVKYKVKYGIFNLGEATASLKIYENGSYETKVEAKATGLASTLSGKRVESYKSVGKVIDGLLVPDSLEKIRSTKKKTKEVFYAFDHERKEITAFEKRCDKNGCSNSSEKMPEYTKDDILTLYHNVAFMFGKGDIKEFNASVVGSKKPVNVIVPEGKQLKTAKKLLDDAEGFYLLIVLNQDVFNSDKGELYINLEDDMSVSKAVLKDTLLFGDVKGSMTEKRVEGSRE
ncbi:MAG: DUF3108 domain-containing protein [Campylobacteraceae bacterium]|jgi:hypothetical protein|nr:DUF3108 domain-containing protein [Campylobacteraceae bacterium]